jgi:hypothetical protein
MSCFKNSINGAKSDLINKGLVDEYMNILDLGKFRARVTELSNYASTTYGVTERLFYDEQNGTKAVPNREAFRKIDRKKGIDKGLFSETSKNINNEPDQGLSELSELSKTIIELSGTSTINSETLRKELQSGSRLVWGTYDFDGTKYVFKQKSRNKWNSNDRADSSSESRVDGKNLEEILSGEYTTVEREFALLSSITQRLYSDSFLGKLFTAIDKQLGNVEIRIVEDSDLGMFYHKDHLYINPIRLIPYLKYSVESGINLNQYLDMVLFEELIHAVVEKKMTDEEYLGIFQRTTQTSS